MTRDEFAALTAYLNDWWVGDLTETEEDSWYVAVGDYSPDDVLRALKVALRTSPKFRPTPGEIIAVLNPNVEAASVPTWTEAQTALFSPRGVLRAYIRRGAPYALAMAEQMHPFLRAYCEAAGLERLAMEEVNDPDHGGAVVHRLGREWDDHVRRCEERLAAGQSLEAMGRKGELGKLDPLAALPSKTPELEAGS